MSNTLPSNHINNLLTVLTNTNSENTNQMRYVFELGALLMQYSERGVKEKINAFPFNCIQPYTLVSMLSTQFNAELLTQAPINWTTSVSIPPISAHGRDKETPFWINHNHQVSLAPLFLLDLHLSHAVPASEDHLLRTNHEKKCRQFQEQCLNILEDKGILGGDAPVRWGALGDGLYSLKEIAVAVNSPLAPRWLNTFEWHNSHDRETTLLSLLSSLSHLKRERLTTTYGQEKRSIGEWFDMFNTLLEKMSAGSLEVDLLRTVSLPHSNNHEFTVAQMIFMILEEERICSNSERVNRAKVSPQHKVKQSDLGPAIENSGKKVLKDILTKSLNNMSVIDQEKVVKDVLDIITADPASHIQTVRQHCIFLMEAAPHKLREVVKKEMLNTSSVVRSKFSVSPIHAQTSPRNGFYFFNSNPIYQNILTVNEAQKILEKEVDTIACTQKKENVWPLLQLMHMCPPQLHSGIKNIIQFVQAGDWKHDNIRITLAAMTQNLEKDFEPTPKRKM